jgi:exportin-T
VKDPSNAKFAISLLIKMTSVWGGPDRPLTSDDPPTPSLPGFDVFLINRFSPLALDALLTPGFNAYDAQSRQLVSEIAGLQLEITKKVGSTYFQPLSEQLKGMGMSEEGVQEHLRNLTQAGEKGFKQYFNRFVASSMAKP